LTKKKPVRKIDLRGKGFPTTIIIMAKEAKSLDPRSLLLVLTDDRETVEQAREWGERVSWASVTSDRKERYWIIHIKRL